ncbi:MAG: VOC family protein [Thermoplasmata archaeon]|nr:VOC family protein [Thermoplasmata archaeon]
MARARSTLYGPMLLVRDIARSSSFYHDTLGLEGDSAGPWAEYRSGESRLVLLDRKFWAQCTGTPVPTGRARKVESVALALQVPNVDRTHRRLTALGVRFDRPPRDIPLMGNRIALLRDPDGHVVELTTRLKAQRPRGAAQS